MSRTFSTALKLLLAGLATTAVRIIGHLSIPDSKHPLSP